MLHSKCFTGQPISTAPGYCFKMIFRRPTQPNQLNSGRPSRSHDGPSCHPTPGILLSALCRSLCFSVPVSVSSSRMPTVPLKSTMFHPSVISQSLSCFLALLHPHQESHFFTGHSWLLSNQQMPRDAHCLGLQHDCFLGMQVPQAMLAKVWG